jgi:hypothetical protein
MKLRCHSTAAWLMAVMAVGATGASARVDEDRLRRLPVAELKRAYLACVAASTRERLDASSAVTCSVVYETLKREAFDGDFDKILAWTRAQAPLRESAAR